MLPKKTVAISLQDAAYNYLHDVLGIAPARRPWLGAQKLPYYLQDEFEFYEIKIAERSILLALNRRKKAPQPTALRERLDKLRSLANWPVVYVTTALASYERKRLIERKIPFLVPGNQLYLPDLGIDFREYFRPSTKAPTQNVSPATQAMIIKALLTESMQHAWHPAAVASHLGYTKMTVSRAVNELLSADIATLVQRGRARWLLMERSPAETWELVKPLLRTPVRRLLWTRKVPVSKGKRVPLAGLSALASYTQLADPPLPILAICASQLEALGLKSSSEIPEPLSDGCQLQVWSYEPIIVPGTEGFEKKAVDPLSLSLSFEDAADERIELALEELKEHFPW